MLIAAATSEHFEGNNKIVWILVIVFTNWIGALIYYFVERPKKHAVGFRGYGP